MQDQHSISVASEIRRKLPAKLLSGIKQLNITVVGEKSESAKGGIIVKVKGYIEVRGEADNLLLQSKLIEAIRGNAGGRNVKNLTTVKKDDPLRKRLHGFF